MATTTSSTIKKVAAETQTIDSFDALLKTNNIFLFIPNIIGKKKKKKKLFKNIKLFI